MNVQAQVVPTQCHPADGPRAPLTLRHSHASAGSWDMARAPELHWNEGDRWSVTVELPTSRAVRTAESPPALPDTLRQQIQQSPSDTSHAIAAGS